MADIVTGQTNIKSAEAEAAEPGPRPSSEKGFRKEQHVPPKYTTDGKEVYQPAIMKRC